MQLKMLFNSVLPIPSNVCLVLILFVLYSVNLIAQETQESDEIELTLPDSMDIKLLVDLVSDQLKMNILYDESIEGKRITVKAPKTISKKALLGILKSSLKIKGLALVEVEEKNWYRVVEVKDLTKISTPESKDQTESENTLAVTRVFPVKHVDPQRVSQILKPFLTEPGGNTQTVQGLSIIVITDYVENFNRLERIIQISDQKQSESVVKFIPLKHIDPVFAIKSIKGILDAKKKVEGSTLKQTLELVEYERTQSLVFVGNEDEYQVVESLLRNIDRPLEHETKSYRFKSASPSQIDELARSLLGIGKDQDKYRSAVDDTSGILLVTAPSYIHEEILRLQSELDQSIGESRPETKFYKLKNAKANQVLQTLRQIEGGGKGSSLSSSLSSLNPITLKGPQRPQLAPGPQGSQQRPSGSSNATNTDVVGINSNFQTNSTLQKSSLNHQTNKNQRFNSKVSESRSESFSSENARIVAEPQTNSLIVTARKELHPIYKDLIEKLDRRIPQVLVEVTIVTVDQSEGFSIGIEGSKSEEDSDGDPSALTFSNFGLNEITDTGRLLLTPGLGFNGTIVSTDVADVVLKTLATEGQAKVHSAPRILINDNASGTLTSVQDAPFTSINASNTVSTTSFGGFENAGTTINLTPHIAEGDHLNLEYSVTLSTFSGEGTSGVPPPRQRNEIDSVATIPDGHTIIVGGLSRTDFSESVSKVPLLGDIPLLGYLFQSRSRNQSQSTLFVFIRPVILRDDRFQDLKYLSDLGVKKAGIKGDYPESEPLTVR